MLPSAKTYFAKFWEHSFCKK